MLSTFNNKIIGYLYGLKYQHYFFFTLESSVRKMGVPVNIILDEGIGAFVFVCEKFHFFFFSLDIFKGLGKEYIALSVSTVSFVVLAHST